MEDITDMMQPVEVTRHDLPSEEHNGEIATPQEEVEEITDIMQPIEVTSEDHNTAVDTLQEEVDDITNWMEQVDLKINEHPHKKRKALIVASQEKEEQITEVIGLEEVAIENFLYTGHDFEVGSSPVDKHNDWLEQVIEKGDLGGAGFVRIFIGNESIDCCRILLQMYSELFRNYACKSSYTFSEEYVTMQAFQMVYEWMKHPNMSTCCSYFSEVLQASSYLRIRVLTERCLVYIDKNFYEAEAVLFYFDMKKLKINFFESMIFRVHKFFLTFVASDDFLILSFKEVASLLNLDTIGVNSEIEVFYAAVRWLNHDWSGRMLYTVALMKIVRLPLLSAWNIWSLIKKKQPANIKNVLEMPGVFNIFSEALAHGQADAAVDGWPEIDIPDEIIHIFVNFPKQRHWIYDGECPYHHCDECAQLVFCTVNYKSFNTYLEILRTKPIVHYQTILHRRHVANCCNQMTEKCTFVESENMITYETEQLTTEQLTT